MLYNEILSVQNLQFFINGLIARVIIFPVQLTSNSFEHIIHVYSTCKLEIVTLKEILKKIINLTKTNFKCNKIIKVSIILPFQSN